MELISAHQAAINLQHDAAILYDVARQMEGLRCLDAAQSEAQVSAANIASQARCWAELAAREE